MYKGPNLDAEANDSAVVSINHVVGIQNYTYRHLLGIFLHLINYP